MKYKSKPHAVKGLLYEPGMEDGHLLHGYEWLPFLLKPLGQELINDGWWIVTFSNGERIQMSPELFEKIYEA